MTTEMRLNTLSPGSGRRDRKRVGRGISAGGGKTCGRGHKGQHSRSGGYHKVGFEGGQMPLQRRVPKVGFTSRKSLAAAEVRTSELGGVEGDVVSLETLQAANIVAKTVKHVKIMLSGDVTRAVTVQGIRASKGATEAIEKAGGKVEA